jgi:hypothetical protein
MLLPACTGTGLATLVTERSADADTSTLAEALLLVEFGSLADVTVSVCVMVEPEVAVALTVTTKVKLAVAFRARPLGVVQVSVPTEQVHPVGPVSDTAEVLAGRVSLKETPVAAAGPAFVIV